MESLRRLTLMVVALAAPAYAQIPWQVQTPLAPANSLGPVVLTPGPDARLIATSPLTNGLAVYRLDGGLEALAAPGFGNFTGLDLRTTAAIPQVGATFVAAAAQSQGQVHVFAVRDGGTLAPVLAAPLVVPFVEKVALAALPDGGLLALAVNSAGLATRVALGDNGQGQLAATPGESFGLGVAARGVAIDDRSRTAFFALPGGLYAHALESDGGVEALQADGGPTLGGAPAGLLVTQTPAGETALIVTVPQTNTLWGLAYTLGALRPLGHATVSLDGGAGAVVLPDAVAVMTAASPGFPAGVMAVADHGNQGAGSNVKLCDWPAAAYGLGIGTTVAPSTDAGAADAGLHDTGVQGGGAGGSWPSDTTAPGPCGCGAGSAPVSLGLVLVFAAFFHRRRTS